MMGRISRSISFRESMRAAAALVIFALATPFSFAQGFLLVAKPLMIDPNFERTVVLAVRTDDDRTIGFVLNRPFNRSLAQILPRNPVLSKFTEPLFNGGPVEPEGLFVLYRGPKPKGTAVAASEKLHLALDPATVEALMSEPQSAVRFYNGYAGWGPGQLQNEIDRGGWWRLDLDEEIIFRKDTSKLWHDLEQRTKRMTAQSAQHAR